MIQDVTLIDTKTSQIWFFVVFAAKGGPSDLESDVWIANVLSNVHLLDPFWNPFSHAPYHCGGPTCVLFALVKTRFYVIGGLRLHRFCYIFITCSNIANKFVNFHIRHKTERKINISSLSASFLRHFFAPFGDSFGRTFPTLLLIDFQAQVGIPNRSWSLPKTI